MKGLLKMRVVFLYFLLRSPLYHGNVRPCACACACARVCARSRVSLAEVRDVCDAWLLPRPPGFSAPRCMRPALTTSPFAVAFCLGTGILISRLLNFTITWFFSTWAMKLYFMTFFLDDNACLLLSLSKENLADFKILSHILSFF